MATEHWFRWHHGTITDPKWLTVASRAKASLSRNVTVGHVVSVWCAMMENASQSSPRGTLCNWSDEDIGAALGMPEDEVCAIRQAMQGKTLDGDVLTGWKRRQPKAEDSTATERKRAQREREKASAPQSTDDVSRNVTTGHDRGEERREEKERGATTSAPTLELVSDDASKGGKTPAKRGTRLPADWQPSDEDLAWARSERRDIDLRAEVATFRDYWLAKAGADAVKLDWSATFRNWIRRAKTTGGGYNGHRAEPQRVRQELTR